MKYLKHILLFGLLSVLFVGCKSDTDDTDNVDTRLPRFLYSTPQDGDVDVLLDAEIAVIYNTPMEIKNKDAIQINGQVAECAISDRKLILTADLELNTTYKITIAAGALTNKKGEAAPEVSFTFTTVGNEKRYEAEDAVLLGNAVVDNTLEGFSGTGYVSQKEGDITFNVTIADGGKYKLDFRFSNGNQQKINYLVVNGEQLASITFEATNVWKTVSVNKIALQQGKNTITIKKSWGWIYLDYMDITPVSDDMPFNIDAALATANPSTQATNVYNYLKENFGKTVLSGAMANYNTGLEEALWMHSQTGKYPAMAAFDFIDYTRTWNWIDYSALVDNSKTWWNNNGIVSIMWHWRDPSRLTDEFYTQKTGFDISKISIPSSSQYQAMIADIDLIAAYLKQLQAAGVPVLWRPLHEASGGWFWWGAKGAEPYKTTWKLMYDRLVNYHGLNNLIWIWTSDGSDADWYPGDAYVDIVGMDIYPGENRHGSQYIAFDKVKAMTRGKKIIALSECGSIPSADAMFEYGDTWSWFMSWNGDYTRSDKHNGASYIKALFENTKVITRDKMPNLN